MLALERLAPVRSAPDKLAPVRSAPDKLAPVRSENTNLAFSRLEFSKSEYFRIDLSNIAFSKDKLAMNLFCRFTPAANNKLLENFEFLSRSLYFIMNVFPKNSDEIDEKMFDASILFP